MFVDQDGIRLLREEESCGPHADAEPVSRVVAHENVRGERTFFNRYRKLMFFIFKDTYVECT